MMRDGEVSGSGSSTPPAILSIEIAIRWGRVVNDDASPAADESSQDGALETRVPVGFPLSEWVPEDVANGRTPNVTLRTTDSFKVSFAAPLE
jgi:hypothetical protein